MNRYSDFEIKTFVGYVAKDADITYYESGSCKATFSLPLKKNKNDEPIWLSVEAWKELAEKVSEEMKKGRRVAVSGLLKTNEYNGKEYTILSLESFKVL